MRKKLTIFGLSLALVLSMILISVGQQPMILPGFNLTDLVDVNAATPSDGYVITWDSATAKWIPAASGGGAGDVTGPGSSTDNAIATFHLATGKIIQQNHSVLIDDSSNISGVNQITVPTIYGSVASGGDLTLYSTSHATLGQIKLESDLETDRWLDQASNTFIGVDVVGAGNLAHVAGDTGYFNSALGASALYSNTTGYLNSAFGHYALYSNTIGHWNSALGKSALRCNTEGHSNLASGMNALYSNTTGDNNSALGYSAGRYQNDGTSALQTPENSVYLGALAKSGSDPAGGEDAITNEIVIGYDATGAGANTVTLGNANIVSTILRGQIDAISIYGTMQTATGDGTTTIDWGLGNYFYFTFGAQNDAFTFTAPANKGRCLLWIKQDGTGSRTINWAGVTIKWPGGVEPTLSTGANDVDIIGLAWDGTSWHGLFNGDFS